LVITAGVGIINTRLTGKAGRVVPFSVPSNFLSRGEPRKRLLLVARIFLQLSLLTFVATGLSGPAQSPGINEKDRDFQGFTKQVQEYVKLQKDRKASLPSLSSTNDTARIIEHQHALAQLIVEARRGARQGDIFTPEVTARFRKIIHKVFQGPEGRFARQTIRPDRPAKALGLHVNDVCSEDMPIITTPPTLLRKLPKLPQELTYRFIGSNLTLQDVEARIIIDLIPNAIR
jgi:hypothetical protein